MDANAIASAAVPVLCLDTCSILDIMRDPTRAAMKVHEREAAIDLIGAAEAGRLSLVIADQVALEFRDHDQNVQDEAQRKLNELFARVANLDRLSAILGAPGQASFAHLGDHVARSRRLVQRWMDEVKTFSPSADVAGKAFARLNAGVAPARKGKESSKDCLVFEAYLEAIAELRTAGVSSPIVFLSSNTTEYQDGSKCRPEISAELAALQASYAPNMAAAKYALGI